MRKILLGLAVLALAGCQGLQPPGKETLRRIDAELEAAAQPGAKPPQPEAVSSALLPPLRVDLPPDSGKPLEPKFDLVVNNAPAAQVFMSIVSGTRYSMLVHPEVTGGISVNLKDVTVLEALEAIRELYGYEYRVDGPRIYMHPLTMQTRVFQVSYLTGSRKGRSELRVTASTAISGSSTAPGMPADPVAAQSGQALVESAEVKTSVATDFWDEVAKSVALIVGTGGGRSVVVSPQTGVIVVRAMPEELRSVAKYLRASQVAVERQVILEAKILEVQLREGYDQGINWSIFARTPNSGTSAGVVTGGTGLAASPIQPIFTGSTVTGNTTTGFTATLPTIVANPGSAILNTGAGVAGGLFGLAFQNASFAALLSFLETQGTVHVLSSPRIATLNNQKAVLKVGQDELFVTNVSGGSTTTGTVIGTTPTISIPTVTFQSFFSGVALDVTPRIDEGGNIILHIHPSVSDVQQVIKRVDTGIAGSFNIPVPRSSVQETDTMVRALDGQIVVLGGLMRQAQTDDSSQVPVAGEMPLVGPLFRQVKRNSEKRELVILLKPTVVKSEGTWSQDILESRERMEGIGQRGGTIWK
jgi:MSHA biogenesis protein MshL